MKFIHINDESDMSQLKDSIYSNNVIFMLIYMEGCGPCNLVRPEWKKLENILRKHKTNPKYKNVVIMDINKDVLEQARTNIKSPSGFPTITFVSKNGSIQENFEDSNIPNKNKEIDAFKLWIKTKLHKNAAIKRSNRRTTKKINTKWRSTRKAKPKRSNRFSSARYYQ